MYYRYGGPAAMNRYSREAALLVRYMIRDMSDGLRGAETAVASEDYALWVNDYLSKIDFGSCSTCHDARLFNHALEDQLREWSIAASEAQRLALIAYLDNICKTKLDGEYEDLSGLFRYWITGTVEPMPEAKGTP